MNRIAATDVLPPGVTLIKPEERNWEPSPSGRDQLYLLGHPNKPGPYLHLVKWPPHSKVLAHKHPDARYCMVMSGVHYIGYGDAFDEAKLHAHPAGSFFTEPADTAHFGITKEEGAVLYFYGMGPSSLVWVEKEEPVRK
jgi:ChrR Cupin-like domain